MRGNGEGKLELAGGEYCGWVAGSSCCYTAAEGERWAKSLDPPFLFVMRQSTGRRDRSNSSALLQTGDLRFPRTFPRAQSEKRLLSPLLKEYLRGSLLTRVLRPSCLLQANGVWLAMRSVNWHPTSASGPCLHLFQLREYSYRRWGKKKTKWRIFSPGGNSSGNKQEAHDYALPVDGHDARTGSSP
ncbi:hypothetical protein ASPTUDRAFT_791683 [Aspergillus tubingensis CBS 134.48]|uniref:Uncharacterized protein n=1 Tax=Aspergillus tubingensis (strain CBS 134.48) TaxID=767770 RepID=A0A1L9MV85_ASPTC|nr:hypothetical protein ASPTUDRAFT_791683 [Aspergillus tubingensis CBS 134.48]